MATRIEAIDARLSAGWNVHMLALGIIFVAAFVGVFEAGNAKSDFANLKNKERTLLDIHRLGQNTITQLRRFLILDYPSASGSKEAVLQLLRDINSQRLHLSGVSTALLNTKSITFEERRLFRSHLNDIANVLQLRFPNDEPSGISPTTALILADTHLGTFTYSETLSSRSMDELARLSFYASVRPRLMSFEPGKNDLVNGYSSESFRFLLSKIKLHRDLINSDPSNNARITAVTLWNTLLSISTNQQENSANLANISPDVISSVISKGRTQLDNLTSYLTGSQKFSVPGSTIALSFSDFISWLPYGVTVLYIYSFIIFYATINILSSGSIDGYLKVSPLYCPMTAGANQYITITIISAAIFSLPLLATFVLLISHNHSTVLGTLGLLISFGIAVTARSNCLRHMYASSTRNSAVSTAII